MFSQTVEYALRAVVILARTPDEPRTTEQVATGTRVPAAYLAKILQTLSKAGLLRSQRGVGGGVTLTRPPAAVTILDVVRAVEPTAVGRIVTCPLGLPTHGSNLCPLHRRLDDAAAQVEKALAATTLAEVLAGPAGRSPLCDVSPVQELTVRGR